MRFGLFTILALPVIGLATPVVAQEIAAPIADDADDRRTATTDEIVVSATRSILPPNALPLTIDVIDRAALDQQVAIGGSVVDAVSNLTPSFSPTRQKL